MDPRGWSIVVVALLAAAFVAALRWRPLAVVGVVLVVQILDLADLYRFGDAPITWSLSFGGLLVASVLAVAYSHQRERARAELERRQAAISLVERLRQLLTVILGYSQILMTKPADESLTVRASSTIDNAARELRDLLDEILARAQSAVERRRSSRPDASGT